MGSPENQEIVETSKVSPPQQDQSKPLHERSWWKVYFGGSGLVPILVPIGFGIAGFFWGKSESSAAFERELLAQSAMFHSELKARKAEWDALTTEKLTTAGLQAAEMRRQSETQWEAKLRAADAESNGLRHRLAIVSEPLRVDLARGIISVDGFFLTETAARALVSEGDYVGKWEFLAPNFERRSWEPTHEVSLKQIEDFVTKGQLSLGPQADEKEASDPEWQRVFWGFISQNAKRSAFVGIGRIERNRFNPMLEAASQKDGSKLPVGIERCPAGIFASGVAFAGLLDAKTQLQEVTDFSAERNGFHLVSVSKREATTIRSEYLLVEKDDILYLVFSIFATEDMIDPSVAEAREWMKAVRIVGSIR